MTACVSSFVCSDSQPPSSINVTGLFSELLYFVLFFNSLDYHHSLLLSTTYVLLLHIGTFLYFYFYLLIHFVISSCFRCLFFSIFLSFSFFLLDFDQVLQKNICGEKQTPFKAHDNIKSPRQ